MRQVITWLFHKNMLEWKKKNKLSLFFFFKHYLILDRHHTQDEIIAERIQQPLGLR